MDLYTNSRILRCISSGNGSQCSSMSAGVMLLFLLNFIIKNKFVTNGVMKWYAIVMKIELWWSTWEESLSSMYSLSRQNYDCPGLQGEICTICQLPVACNITARLHANLAVFCTQAFKLKSVSADTIICQTALICLREVESVDDTTGMQTFGLYTASHKCNSLLICMFSTTRRKVILI